tara:strand:+ start:2711 stop:3292 length:582 start_codon:yes stop_codon:yes gene_type:complete
LAATLNGNKNKLRIDSLTARKSYNNKTIDKHSILIAQNLVRKFDFKEKNIHLFFPIKNKKEVNTWYLYNLIKESSKLHTSVLSEKSKQWDCINFEKTNNFTTTRFKVPIPINYQFTKWREIDYIIVPLLCFDSFGNRIGYGKGIYDKILNKTKFNCIKIGVSLLKCSTQKIDSEPHDIPLDYCQTPFQLHQFK